MNKLYIIKKYVSANSLKEALKKDKVTPVDDIWIDENFRTMQLNEIQNNKEINFNKK